MRATWLCLLTGLLCSACGYRHYASALRPAESDVEEISIADDGTVTFTQERLEVRLRPMTDEELNRQFAAPSAAGTQAINPYTFSGADLGEAEKGQVRFTVFRLSVKNYAYPKVRIDPAEIVLRTGNGREYWSLTFGQLDNYYRPYAIGYRGNEYATYQERRDLLRRTLFGNEPIFSGQEADGYVVFPSLHADVRDVEIEVQDVVLRFDFRNEPVETRDITYRFTRDVGREYPDGRVVVDQPSP
ncbi:MAG: hypothetical protein AB1505_14040 [Candidatus Latescibacterota bacterium]